MSAEVVVGVGFRAGTDPSAAIRQVAGAHVDVLASIDRRRAELESIAAGFGARVVTFTAAELAAVQVPNPAERTRAAIGTPSVAEAAALLASGGPLATAKTVVGGVVVAVARNLRANVRTIEAS